MQNFDSLVTDSPTLQTETRGGIVSGFDFLSYLCTQNELDRNESFTTRELLSRAEMPQVVTLTLHTGGFLSTCMCCCFNILLM